MIFHYAGKYNGDESSLPYKEHHPNATLFKEPEDTKKLSLIANVGCILIMGILAIPFLILACKQIWKKILVLCMTILITILAVQGPIYKIFNINYSNPAEALSIPMQQFARISKYAGYRISEEDKKTI